MEAIELIDWILITFKLKDKLKLKLEEIMDFLIENKNNANQNFKFLTIIMNYPNFKKILTFPLSTKIAQTNTKIYIYIYIYIICQTKKINCNYIKQKS